MYTSVYMCVFLNMSVCVYVPVCSWVSYQFIAVAFVHAFVCLCVCVCVCVYVCVCVIVFVCT